MMYDLPIAVEIDGEEYKIRQKCDYRVVLDCIAALNDKELTKQEQIECALFIFYESLNNCSNIEAAVMEMFKIINNGEDAENEDSAPKKQKVMDWSRDFKLIAPPISRVLGYDVRTSDKYTHWWTFLGGYMEIGECTFSTVVSIRNKKNKRTPLDKWEEDYYRENRKMIDLPIELTPEEEQELNSEW